MMMRPQQTGSMMTAGGMVPRAGGVMMGRAVTSGMVPGFLPNIISKATSQAGEPGSGQLEPVQTVTLESSDSDSDSSSSNDSSDSNKSIAQRVAEAGEGTIEIELAEDDEEGTINPAVAPQTPLSEHDETVLEQIAPESPALPGIFP